MLKSFYMKTPQNTIKYFIGLLVVLGLRLAPHPPNVEPIMSSMMPFSKKWGWLSGLIFCLLAVFGFDLITGTLGQWSLITATTYGVLGALAGIYLKNKPNKVRYYVGYAIVATLIYDAVTGIGMGVLMFKMPFMLALTGQIPFTLYHLAGNIALSAVVSPVLYRWVVENRELETAKLLARAGVRGWN